MADQAAMSEMIAKAIAEAMRVAIWAMTDAQTQRMSKTSGPKVDGPVIKQSSFNWEATDKVHQVEGLYPQGKKCAVNIQLTRDIQNSDGKELAGEERAPLH